MSVFKNGDKISSTHQPRLHFSDNLMLSEKEKQLLNFIKERKEVTIEQIESKLSTAHTGALGKLMSNELIESKKKRESNEEETNIVNSAGYNLYSRKMTKYYMLKEEK